MTQKNVTQLNETHDPALQSWVSSANFAGTDFPIQNLPFAVFRRSGSNETFRGGVAIGDAVLDLAAVHAKGIFTGPAGLAVQTAAATVLPTSCIRSSAMMVCGAALASQGNRSRSSCSSGMESVVVVECALR